MTAKQKAGAILDALINGFSVCAVDENGSVDVKGVAISSAGKLVGISTTSGGEIRVVETSNREIWRTKREKICDPGETLEPADERVETESRESAIASVAGELASGGATFAAL